VNGSTKDDETLANLVWYQNTSEEELKRILTDTDGVQHKYSLGVGKIQPEIKACQRVIATEVLPPCFSEIFQKIEQPFIQAITDSLVTKAAFMNGRVLLIGDAVAGLRPHTTAGTTQAALHALLLGKVFGDREEMNLEEWEKTVLAWSTFVHGEGIKLGNLSQFGDHPMAENEA
jgi:2-polyprenyl-6-methoxyphenol hydroxylase-like FAD-dependent oxidoreductase